MKVAVVGIGQIAEAHLSELQKIDYVDIVAIVDLRKSPLKAIGEKYNIPNRYQDCSEMFKAISPDVVHITTPPGPHLALAKTCLENGADVYIEKPLTITLEDAEKLFQIAEAEGRKVYLGANRLYAEEQQKALLMARNGELGQITHIDSIFSYDLKGIFGRQILANPQHWIAQLPGQVFQNNLNHPLAPIVPFLSNNIKVNAWAADWSDNQVVYDELRLNIIDFDNKLTCNIVFTSNVKPAVFKTRYFGTQKAVSIDNYSHTYQIDSSPSFPGILGNVLSIRQASKSLYSQFLKQLVDFLFGRRTYFSDMKDSFEAFYSSIKQGTSMPITHRDALLASQIMEEAFNQIGHPLSDTGASNR